ncbi:MAG: NADH-quinone oxidoreductase subunit C [Desulfobacteraceae bacterium]|nr:NADH-quinone oxidoreductase subunit C [Desulfobacteraceae bacterium]
MKAQSLFVNMDQLLGEAAKLQVEGYRYVALTAVEIDGQTVELIYHFDLNLGMRHLRLSVQKGTRVPSITPVYLAAFLAENEIQDLFGVVFSGLAVDFKGTLYTENEMRGRVPFCRYTVVGSEKGEAAGQGDNSREDSSGEAS